jgi:hypothetical protein
VRRDRDEMAHNMPTFNARVTLLAAMMNYFMLLVSKHVFARFVVIKAGHG